MYGMQDDKPTKNPVFSVGDKIMGFGLHYPISGTIKDMKWNTVDLEWEYFVENNDGYDGKIKEGKILRFDQIIWDDVETKWENYVQLMKDAAAIELECKKLLRR